MMPLNQLSTFRELLRFSVDDSQREGVPFVVEYEGKMLSFQEGKALLDSLDSQALPPPKEYLGGNKMACDLCRAPLESDFVDGRLHGGTMWANMCMSCWRSNGCGHLGTGYGQHYRARMGDKGVKRWIKVEG